MNAKTPYASVFSLLNIFITVSKVKSNKYSSNRYEQYIVECMSLFPTYKIKNKRQKTLLRVKVISIKFFLTYLIFFLYNLFSH